MKLRSKQRDGARVRKKYDKAQTPYQRILASIKVEKRKKERLRAIYQKLNPAQLKREITRLQNQLIELATRRNAAQQEPAPGKQKMPKGPSANHPWRNSWSKRSIREVR
jgi:hypothetical protein